ncbi:MAG: radical SAM protein [Clostridia bacterium]|nr:radical SAM protein [Clostridia bacterium]
MAKEQSRHDIIREHMHEIADRYKALAREKERTSEQGDYSASFHMNAYSQLSFLTEGCKTGRCSFCAYGQTNSKLTPKQVGIETEKFIQEIEQRIREGNPTYAVLFDSVGSIFDRNEFSPESLDVVFKKLDELLERVPMIEEVAFETHYGTLGTVDKDGVYVSSEALDKLVDFKKKHQSVGTYVIELGLESTNPELRTELLFKPIDNEMYKRSVKHLHDNGINVDVNIMATLPFLTKKEQIANAVTSTMEALKPYEEGGFGVDNVVLFPLNVRENTFMGHSFKSIKAYEQQYPDWEKPNWLDDEFPIWSLVATLNTFIETGHEDMLSKISVAWFGGRSVYESDIEPKDWEDTYDAFVQYRKNGSGENSRANIIRKLTQHPKYKAFMESIKNEPQTNLSFADRAEFIQELNEKVGLPIKSPCERRSGSESGEDE